MHTRNPGTIQQMTTDRTLVHKWLADSGLGTNRAYSLRRAAPPFVHRLTWYPGRVLQGIWEPAHYVVTLPAAIPGGEIGEMVAGAVFFGAPADEALFAQVTGYVAALYEDGDAIPAPEVIDRLYDFAWYLKHGALQ
jgi:hypothetical protein